MELCKVIQNAKLQIVYKKTDECYIEWQQVAWQRMATSGKTNDNEWKGVTTSDRMIDNEEQQMARSGTTNENASKSKRE